MLTYKIKARKNPADPYLWAFVRIETEGDSGRRIGDLRIEWHPSEEGATELVTRSADELAAFILRIRRMGWADVGAVRTVLPGHKLNDGAENDGAPS